MDRTLPVSQGRPKYVRRPRFKRFTTASRSGARKYQTDILGLPDEMLAHVIACALDVERGVGSRKRPLSDGDLRALSLVNWRLSSVARDRWVGQARMRRRLGAFLNYMSHLVRISQCHTISFNLASESHMRHDIALYDAGGGHLVVDLSGTDKQLTQLLALPAPGGIARTFHTCIVSRVGYVRTRNLESVASDPGLVAFAASLWFPIVNDSTRDSTLRVHTGHLGDFDHPAFGPLHALAGKKGVRYGAGLCNRDSISVSVHHVWQQWNTCPDIRRHARAIVQGQPVQGDSPALSRQGNTLSV